jgi:hypothetical protein
VDCDLVVRVRLIFEYDALPAAAAGQAATSPLQFVFASRYVAVPEFDAWLELGSRDFTVRACTGSGVIVPVQDVVRPRRHTPVRESQWPPGWPGVAQGGSAVPGTVQPRPEYIWFR